MKVAISIAESADLPGLVRALREAVRNGELTREAVNAAVAKLPHFGRRQYDREKFPQLVDTANFPGTVGDTPQNLSEALLWKLGKWKVYRTFVANFCDGELEVSDVGGVVLSAFAKHLQDNSHPIFDQHAVRALWAIGAFSEHEEQQCKSLLLNNTGNWKDVGSGDGAECYATFCAHIKSICDRNGIQSGELDYLLMPLGQAIKKSTRQYRNAQAGSTDYDGFLKLRQQDADASGSNPATR